MLKISELAARTGLSAHTIRFYEKHGLISASERSEAGYRYYSEADLRRAEFVKTARNIGFSLHDIGQLLSIRLDKDSHSCQEVTDITQHKLNEVNSRISELKMMQETLERLLESCCGGPENATHCSIIEALEAGSVSADTQPRTHNRPSHNDLSYNRLSHNDPSYNHLSYNHLNHNQRSD